MWVPTEHELSVYQLAPLQFSRPQSGSDGSSSFVDLKGIPLQFGCLNIEFDVSSLGFGIRYAVGPISLSGENLPGRASLPSRSVGAAAPSIAALSATAS